MIPPRPRFVPKVTADGRRLLNIGCGWKMHPAWTNVDFSPYAKLARRPIFVKALRMAGLLSPLREERLRVVDRDIICWDLRRGVPFSSDAFDVVYHSHFLEHVERDAAAGLLRECARVLKVGGTLRVVVPDWEQLARRYLAALEAWDGDANHAASLHSHVMHEMIDQMVRTNATGATNGSLRGKLENRIRGGAAGVGELHRWMYDRRSLAALFESIGLREIQKASATTSRVNDWSVFGLDVGPDGREYKPESLYMEAVK